MSPHELPDFRAALSVQEIIEGILREASLDAAGSLGVNFVGQRNLLFPKSKKPREGTLIYCNGGETGIRTLEGLASLLVFKTSAFNRSAISPHCLASL